MMLKRFSWALILCCSFNAFADVKEIKIKDLPIDSIRPRVHGTISVFNESFQISKKTPYDKQSNARVLKQTPECTSLAPVRFKRRKVKDIKEADMYRLSIVKNKTDTEPLRLTFFNYNQTPTMYWIECNDLDENATVSQLEEASGKLITIKVGSAVDTAALANR
jgi:hypothetical protein